MAGLYIHVPFCKKRCLYCDFYSNTDTTLKEAYIQALVREMELRKAYLKGVATLLLASSMVIGHFLLSISFFDCREKDTV